MNGAPSQLRKVYWSRSSSEMSTAVPSGTTMTSAISTPPGTSIQSGFLTGLLLGFVERGLRRGLGRLDESAQRRVVHGRLGEIGNALHHDVDQGQLYLTPRAGERRTDRLAGGLDDRRQG